MVNDSFYIGIPCGGNGDIVPVEYSGPDKLIYNNATEIIDIPNQGYNNRPFDIGPYAVYYLNDTIALNDTENAYTHDYTGVQCNFIYNYELLPPGTRVWKMEEHAATAGYYIDYSHEGFGDARDDGTYVNVYAFQSPTTLYPGGSYNKWFYADGKYRFFGNTNNLWAEYAYPIYPNHRYTFNLKTYSEYDRDGIILSLFTLAIGSVSNSGEARAHGVSGSTSTLTWTYNSHINSHVYFYFRTDGSTLKGPASAVNSSASVDYTYGEVEVIDVPLIANSINYEPSNQTVYIASGSTSGSKQVTIAGTGSCRVGSLNYSTSRWSISSNGRYLTIPENTPAGTYNVTITVTSPNSGNYYSVTVKKTITITIIEDEVGWDLIYFVDDDGHCFNELFDYTGYNAVYSNGQWNVEYGYGEMEDVPAIIPTFFTKKLPLPASAFTVNRNNINEYVETHVKLIQAYRRASDNWMIQYWTEITSKSWSGSITLTSLGTTVTGVSQVSNLPMLLYFYPNEYVDMDTGYPIDVAIPLNTGGFSLTREANALTGIELSLGSNPINYNSTTTATVTATYTSGSSKDVTSSLSTSSSATSNYIKSGDTSVVTIS